MTTEQNHPITPPPELVQQWANSSPIQHSDESWAYELFIAHQAARWGADQELEACCEYLTHCAAWEPEDVKEFCDLRRPKPPSLKQQALETLRQIPIDPEAGVGSFDLDIIRRALEQLND